MSNVITFHKSHQHCSVECFVVNVYVQLKSQRCVNLSALTNNLSQICLSTVDIYVTRFTKHRKKNESLTVFNGHHKNELMNFKHFLIKHICHIWVAILLVRVSLLSPSTF